MVLLCILHQQAKSIELFESDSTALVVKVFYLSRVV